MFSPSVLFVFLCLPSLALSLQCWSGWQIWEQSINNVSLVTCSSQHKCCFFVTSLPGSQYDCYSDCPAPGVEACGPDPALGIQDVYYCYCRDHNDSRCRPYLGEK